MENILTNRSLLSLLLLSLLLSFPYSHHQRHHGTSEAGGQGGRQRPGCQFPPPIASLLLTIQGYHHQLGFSGARKAETTSPAAAVTTSTVQLTLPAVHRSDAVGEWGQAVVVVMVVGILPVRRRGSYRPL